MDLIIVESPTKAKTISRFVGSQYKVESSFGHIRDLPRGKLGVDTEHNFEPTYVIPAKARTHVSELKEKMQKADTVILATDEDREGEAIAWHLVQALGLGKFQASTQKEANTSRMPLPSQHASKTEANPKPYQRIVFHEITKSAIERALQEPRDIDMDKVNAQQARRILDRLVGYKLSPFLWKKVMKGLSAGRVQSVAVRLIVEREREIENFVPQEYWTITARFQSKNNNQKTKTPAGTPEEFEAVLTKKNGKPIPKLGIKNKEEADAILKDIENAEYNVTAIEQREKFKYPMPPFTTSTLQQAAWQRIRLNAKRTMRLAQALYEKGYITYHRTDSFHIAKQALEAAHNTIEHVYGKEYALVSPRNFRTKSKGAQEAHEAIRPTYPQKKPEDVKNELEPREWKLYDLIWRRFIASQMKEARFDSVTVDISAAEYEFRATGLTMKFDGFLRVYPMKFEEATLPPLTKDETLTLLALVPTQHFTKPPARYNDASLVKALEARGIGRPSTYAPIIDTIQQRDYVRRNEEKYFVPTEVGIMVNDLLVEHFSNIVDIDFTARMEEDLDKIARGEKEWRRLIESFYKPFAETLEKKYEAVAKKDLTEKTGEKCPLCGEGDRIIRFGRFGKFIACSRFPECTYTQPILEHTGVACPACGEGDIVERISKKRKKFYGCSRYPACGFVMWNKPTGEKCAVCGSLMAQKGKNKIACSNKECSNSK